MLDEDWKRKTIKNLPKPMFERALWARNEFINNPKNSEIDEESLIWCFNEEDNLWYSILGNYSSLSPENKRLKQEARDTEYSNRMATGVQSVAVLCSKSIV